MTKTDDEAEELAIHLAGKDGYRAAEWHAVDEAVRSYYRKAAREELGRVTSYFRP